MIELHTVNQNDDPDDRFCSGCGDRLRHHVGRQYATLGRVKGNGLVRVCRACVMRVAAAFLAVPHEGSECPEIYDLREGS